MYEKYTTEGIILETRDSGESNRFYIIYTNLFGRVGATAQGVRLMKSKLRYSLQAFLLSEISLVRGKGVWRITNASFKDDLFGRVAKEPERRSAFLSITALLNRLVVGEERDELLYEIIHDGLHALASCSDEDIKHIELLLTARILDRLGYIGESALFSRHRDSRWKRDALEQVRDDRKKLLGAVNESLKEIQL